jgi:hypothetical protein
MSLHRAEANNFRRHNEAHLRKVASRRITPRRRRDPTWRVIVQLLWCGGLAGMTLWLLVQFIVGPR